MHCTGEGKAELGLGCLVGLFSELLRRMKMEVLPCIPRIGFVQPSERVNGG